jgi:hypothetical protein
MLPYTEGYSSRYSTWPQSDTGSTYSTHPSTPPSVVIVTPADPATGVTGVYTLDFNNLNLVAGDRIQFTLNGITFPLSIDSSGINTILTGIATASVQAGWFTAASFVNGIFTAETLIYGDIAAGITVVLEKFIPTAAPYTRAANQALSGRCIYTFTYTTQTATYPLFFVKPSNYNLFYAVISQIRAGNTWTVQVIHSGATPAAPELHAFVGPTALPEPTEDVGLQVFLDNGVTAFDSRKGPLSVQAGGMAKPPNDPTDGAGLPVVDTAYRGHDTWARKGPETTIDLDHDFRCDTTFTSKPISLSGALSDYMFCAPSLGQACFHRYWMGYKVDSGYFSDQDHWSEDTWWVLYRSAYRLTSSMFDAGWATYKAGHTLSSRYEGGIFHGSGSSYSSGLPPFDSKTVNNDAENAFLITKRSLYT